MIEEYQDQATPPEHGATDQAPELTTKQRAFIAAMLASPSISAAARDAGINETTAHRWLKLAHVHQALEDARRDVFNASLTEIKLAVRLAVATLKKHCQDEETPPQAQIRAAQIILEQAIELHKVAELEQKIAELEALVVDQANNTRR